MHSTTPRGTCGQGRARETQQGAVGWVRAPQHVGPAGPMQRSPCCSAGFMPPAAHPPCKVPRGGPAVPPARRVAPHAGVARVGKRESAAAAHAPWGRGTALEAKESKEERTNKRLIDWKGSRQRTSGGGARTLEVRHSLLRSWPGKESLVSSLPCGRARRWGQAGRPRVMPSFRRVGRECGWSSVAPAGRQARGRWGGEGCWEPKRERAGGRAPCRSGGGTGSSTRSKEPVCAVRREQTHGTHDTAKASTHLSVVPHSFLGGVGDEVGGADHL